MAKKNKQTVIGVTIRGVDLEFKSPTAKVWGRYVEKIRRGTRNVGRRELVAKSCVSHSGKEAADLIGKAPAAIRAIAEHLEGLAVGEVECTVNHDDFNVSLVFNGEEFILSGPDLDQWELFQGRLDDEGNRFHEEMVTLLSELCDGDDTDLELQMSRSPAAVTIIVDAVSKLAGAGVEVKVKKG